MKAPSIVAVRRALPPRSVDQEEALAALVSMRGGGVDPARVAKLHRAIGVRRRSLALPLEEYAGLDTLAKRNSAWLRHALDLGEEATRGALEAAGLKTADVDHIFFTTVTGIAVPSLCARLANRLGFKPGIKRTPLFGLGCLAGSGSCSQSESRTWRASTPRAMSTDSSPTRGTYPRRRCFSSLRTSWRPASRGRATAG